MIEAFNLKMYKLVVGMLTTAGLVNIEMYKDLQIKRSLDGVNFLRMSNLLSQDLSSETLECCLWSTQFS